MMIRNSLFSLLLVFFLSSCDQSGQREPVDYINPFIGTGGHGHTYPGATVPFGMVQLSPDTRKDSWDGCSGYHYSDTVIFGFSHTHLSGTGIGDYGDVRFMPMTGQLKTEPAYDDPGAGYGSVFSHDRETAEAGYYAVHLNDHNIYAAFTATEHAGFHKYLFAGGDDAHILLDLVESVTTEERLETGIWVTGNTEVSGVRRTRGWASDQYIYFHAEFSKPFSAYGLLDDEGIVETSRGEIRKAYFDFNLEAGETVLLKVGISAVDVEGAKNNLRTEIPGWDFEAVRRAARDSWAGQLKKIEIDDPSDQRKEIFYTALYHTMLAPNIYSDVDGRYRDHSRQVAVNDDVRMYTIFSLWDTFRALHPLFTIIERERTLELVRSMLAMYRDEGRLPVWELAACETDCMIGYHSVPVIVDAYKKGITGFDGRQALEAMMVTAGSGLFGLDSYIDKGYIPADREGSSVSKTLEYAYDDWCIAEMADMLGDEEARTTFLRRAQYYKNLYDPGTGFFRGKSNGCFVEPFDPAEVNFMLTEANTWQYNFFVPQDINTHIDMLGGEGSYEAKLDALFTSEEGLSGRHQSDITGLIGQYAHGNEPSHHMAYLYNYVGKPGKTQQLVNRIMTTLYANEPDGLSGNEDCGQMSAWYVMSAMGFYPVTPGSDIYAVGTPAFRELKLNLENGRTLTIKAQDLSPDHFYIREVYYNGEPWKKSFITHEMIMNGGELLFVMDKEPGPAFGIAADDRPVQRITEHLITPVPYFMAASRTFEDRLKVGIGCSESGASLEINKKGKDKNYKPYEGPVVLSRNTTLVARAISSGKASFPEEATFVRIPAGLSVSIKYPYSSQYTAGGDIALVNTIRGGAQFTTGNWQGYWGDDLVATIDMGKSGRISSLGAGFLQDQNSWIFMPLRVSFEVSPDGKDFHPVGTVENTIDEKADGSLIRDFKVDFKKQKVRYIRITAKNRGTCPEWHKGYPNPAWIFADEVWWK